jgi:hypothetical protein
MRWYTHGDPLIHLRSRPGEPLLCAVEGCGQPTIGRGWCKLHYNRWVKHGDVAADVPHRNRPKVCGVEGCLKPYKASGYCQMHLQRLRRHGDLGRGRPHRSVHPSGYVLLFVGREAPGNRAGYIFEHRVVMEGLIGRPLLRHENVHHVNGDRADNRPQNLELWSSTQPSGQRVVDKVRWAREIIALYGDLVDRMAQQ